MTAPDGLIRIPLNEESGQNGGQIEEFLMQFNGEGIQHIALLTDDLLASVDALQMAGILITAATSIGGFLIAAYTINDTVTDQAAIQAGVHPNFPPKE